jgi:hypothetical protein
VFRDEGEHRFRDEAEQFQADPEEVPFATRRTLDDGEPGSLFSPTHLKKVVEGWPTIQELSARSSDQNAECSRFYRRNVP